MNVTAKQIAEVLGGRANLGRQVRTTRELESVVRAGIPKRAFDRLIQSLSKADGQKSTRTKSSLNEFGVQIRSSIVPRATYQRVDRFNLQVSETTERIARLYAIALSIFEDRELARQFLFTPHPELDNRRPFDVALTEIGGRQVEEVIERGLHGLPA